MFQVEDPGITNECLLLPEPLLNHKTISCGKGLTIRKERKTRHAYESYETGPCKASRLRNAVAAWPTHTFTARVASFSYSNRNWVRAGGDAASPPRNMEHNFQTELDGQKCLQEAVKM